MSSSIKHTLSDECQYGSLFHTDKVIGSQNPWNTYIQANLYYFTCSCEVWKKMEQKHVHDLIKL